MKRYEDGAAVVIAIGLVAVLTLVAVTSAGVVAIIATHRQVQSAADLAALAGAAAGQEGRTPCADARRIGARNGVLVSRCQVVGLIVTVVVERRLPRVLGDRVLRARARAGPAEPSTVSPA